MLSLNLSKHPYITYLLKKEYDVEFSRIYLSVSFLLSIYDFRLKDKKDRCHDYDPQWIFNRFFIRSLLECIRSIKEIFWFYHIDIISISNETYVYHDEIMERRIIKRWISIRLKKTTMFFFHRWFFENILEHEEKQMKIKNSMKYFNESIKSSILENRIESNRTFFESQSVENIRKYTESLNTFEYRCIRSLFQDNNHRFGLHEDRIPKNLYIFLEYSFLSLFYLISKPFLEITPDKIVLSLFCFRLKKNIVSYDNNKLSNENKEFVYNKDSAYRSIDKIDRIKLRIISLILRRLFKKSVELEIIRLHYPFYETNIFVNLLSKTINKIKIRRILSKFFDKANIFDPNKLIGKKIHKIPSFISGVKIRIAGRLLTQRIVPRQTVKTISKGSLARGKVIYLEKGNITNKNKRGAFNVTVTIGHIKNRNI